MAGWLKSGIPRGTERCFQCPQIVVVYLYISVQMFLLGCKDRPDCLIWCPDCCRLAFLRCMDGIVMQCWMLLQSCRMFVCIYGVVMSRSDGPVEPSPVPFFSFSLSFLFFLSKRYKTRVGVCGISSPVQLRLRYSTLPYPTYITLRYFKFTSHATRKDKAVWGGSERGPLSCTTHGLDWPKLS